MGVAIARVSRMQKIHYAIISHASLISGQLHRNYRAICSYVDESIHPLWSGIKSVSLISTSLHSGSYRDGEGCSSNLNKRTATSVTLSTARDIGLLELAGSDRKISGVRDAS